MELFWFILCWEVNNELHRTGTNSDKRVLLIYEADGCCLLCILWFIDS